jgi:hypothetical protein
MGARSPYRHLLKPIIFDLAFVYEEGVVDFKKADKNGQLTNLDMLSLQQWKKGILVVHFLFPSKKQASNTRTAEGANGQATFADFVQPMHKYQGPDIRFVFYDPTKTHSTNFYSYSMGHLLKHTHPPPAERKSSNASSSIAHLSFQVPHYGRQRVTMPITDFELHKTQTRRKAQLVLQCRP